MATTPAERLSVSITVMVSERTRTWLEEQAKTRWPADIAPVVRDALDHYRTSLEAGADDTQPGSPNA